MTEKLESGIRIAKAGAPVGGAIGAAAVIKIIADGLELTSIRGDVQVWLVSIVTALLFALWPWLTRKVRALTGETSSRTGD
tara:strand:+ start:313 stop:555 length:243 start_codon:yes stop_codon:yes gene_type:complete